MLFKILWQNCKINLLFFFKSIQKNLCFLEFFNFLLLLLCISISIFTIELHHWLHKYSAIKKKVNISNRKKKQRLLFYLLTPISYLDSYQSSCSRSKRIFRQTTYFRKMTCLQCCSIFIGSLSYFYFTHFQTNGNIMATRRAPSFQICGKKRLLSIS